MKIATATTIAITKNSPRNSIPTAFRFSIYAANIPNTPTCIARPKNVSIIFWNTESVWLNLFAKSIISKLKHIQTYYSNFMGNGISHSHQLSIRVYGGLRAESQNAIRYAPLLTGLIVDYIIYFIIVNTRVLTQTLLGFYRYRSLWDEGISNDPNGLCRTTSHRITTIVNTRRLVWQH